MGRLACGFMLIMELVPKKKSSTVGAALMVCQGSVLILWSGYFAFISKQAIWFLSAGVALNFITAILCFTIPESPKYFFAKERFDECRESIAIIARRNGVHDY